MRFAFSDDQLLFRDTVRDFFQKECPPDAVRASWHRDDGDLPEVWQALADMGVVGALLAEGHGGLGMDELDVVLLLEEAGRVAFPGPLVESAFVGAPLLQEVASTDDRIAALLPRLASGEATVAVALDVPSLVLGAEVAAVTVLERNGALVAVDRDRLALAPQPSVDGSRRLFTFECADRDDDVIAEDDAARAAIGRARDRGALGTAAELVGLADQLLAMTVDYVKEREQFGVAIGSFQAIKHHVADALLALEFARPVVYRAAYSVARGLPTASRDVSMAKCYASDAASLVGRHALQCHGAIGYTVEYDLHLWLKRVWALSAAWGDAAHHRARVAESVLGPRP
jgi:alkylation response protein AidB-like acyl-CoA dehydrogenase